MRVKLLYFAWVREKVGRSCETVDVPDFVTTVAALVDWLKDREPEFTEAFADREVICVAVDQAHVQHEAVITEASEIAFFPPVTGG
jgi:molybdopterin synthase sulfur carrier subunit